jgi:hypothetical protein
MPQINGGEKAQSEAVRLFPVRVNLYCHAYFDLSVIFFDIKFTKSL